MGRWGLAATNGCGELLLSLPRPWRPLQPKPGGLCSLCMATAAAAMPKEAATVKSRGASATSKVREGSAPASGAVGMEVQVTGHLPNHALGPSY